MVENYVLGRELLAGNDPGPHGVEDIRYYNNGIVLAGADEMRAFLAWALPLAARLGPAHDRGSAFVADQH